MVQLPVGIEQYGVKVYTDMTTGLKDVDVVIMLRLQRERMAGGLLPSEGEFYRLFGLTTVGSHRAHDARPFGCHPWFEKPIAPSVLRGSLPILPNK